MSSAPDNISSLAVFCGSKTGSNPNHARVAAGLGRLLVEWNVGLVYGGGGIGIMGVLAETVLEGNGSVTGVIPKFLMELEVGDPGVTELIITESMHERKLEMFKRSDAFLVLPGGLGTLEEVMEILTWKQLQLHRKPVVIINADGYWDHFPALLQSTVDGGFAHPAVMNLFSVITDLSELHDALSNAPAVGEEVLTSHLL